jgi:hypothetical protein
MSAFDPKQTYGSTHWLDTVFALVRNSTSLEALAKTIFVATDFPVFRFANAGGGTNA